MAAVMLHCPADLLKLYSIAHEARRTALQEVPENVTANERKDLKSVLLTRTVKLLGVLSLCINTKEGGTNIDNDNESVSPDAGASITDLEGEVQQLEQEVLAASQRVVQLRGSVPAALSDNLREKLEQCRPAWEPPAAAGGEAEAGAQQDAGEREEAALCPAPAQLQGNLASAVLKMPTLRAKLEDGLQRLQRIMSAMAEDAAQAPPNTVERAARGLATPARGASSAAAAVAGEGTPSPRLAEALSSGKIATRRRIASNLRPVPYPKH